MSLFLTVLSQIAGWIYFSAWSINYYFQIHLNYQLKNVEGYSFNYVFLNLSGFLAYFLYSLWGYLDPGVMPGTVAIQDIAFTAHVLILNLILNIQCFYYDRRFFSLISWWVKIFLILVWLISSIICPLQLSGKFLHSKQNFNACLWLGYLKIMITLMKYFPQAVKNYLRQSTKGWSIISVLLDFTGGFFSIAQIFIDGANGGNWNIFGGGSFNIAKFCIGFISMIFDVVFFIQHYFLYRPGKHINRSSNFAIKVKLNDSS